MPKKPGRIPRDFTEPQFSYATLEFAESLSNLLLAAAEQARPDWLAMTADAPGAIDAILDQHAAGTISFNDPFMRRFTGEWVRRLGYPTSCIPNRCLVNFPPHLTAEVRRWGHLSSLNFFFGALNADAWAQLWDNDHNLDYALCINLPPWLQSATAPDMEGWDSFKRRLKMAIHHETGHFRYVLGDDPLRDEHLAHARGVASLRDGEWPVAPNEVARLLEAEHPEAWEEQQIRDLVLVVEGGCDLIRIWAKRRARTREPNPPEAH